MAKSKPRSLRTLDGLLTKAKSQKEYNAIRDSFSDEEDNLWFEREFQLYDRLQERITKQVRRIVVAAYEKIDDTYYIYADAGGFREYVLGNRDVVEEFFPEVVE